MQWETLPIKPKGVVGGVCFAFNVPIDKKEYNRLLEVFKMAFPNLLYNAIPMRMSGERMIDWAKHFDRLAEEDQRRVKEILSNRE